MTDFDSDEAREARLRARYCIPPGRPLTEHDLEIAERMARSEEDGETRRLAVEEVLLRRLELVRAQPRCHLQVAVRDSDPWGQPGPFRRRECSCGHRGVWLRNPEKIAACPRAPLQLRRVAITSERRDVLASGRRGQVATVVGLWPRATASLPVEVEFSDGVRAYFASGECVDVC